MMNIIGHRGAAGLAKENTLKSIKAALSNGVDGIEFDIHATKDRKIVLSHDNNLLRTYGIDKNLSSMTLTQVLNLNDRKETTIPTLHEALKVTKKHLILIEGKGKDWARGLAYGLKNHKNINSYRVISFNHKELYTFGQLCPGVKLYALENHNAFDAITATRTYGFDGIDINYWLLNPLIYWICKRKNLDITVYTVNKTWIARFLRILYPDISITTDFPNKMRFLRR